MALKDLEDTLANTLRENSRRESEYGYYHPSTISGCPLKGFLDKMTETSTELNNYMFQGSAVHFYLQENPELLTQALYDAGFHPLDTRYEVHTIYEMEDGIHLTGTCDALANGDNGVAIVDIKYSSVRPETHQGRLFQYMSQTNTYSHMFGADEYGLLLLYSYANDNQSGNKPQNIPDSILLLPGEPNEDNWEMVKSKARQIHYALGEFGFPDGERWEDSYIPDEWWDKILGIIDRGNCPAYEKECNYCDHSDHCPVFNSGLKGMGR